MIATIGTCLSPTADMIKAVYEICGNQNSRHYSVEMITTVVHMAKNIQNPIQDGVGEVVDDLDRAYGGRGWSPLMIASLRGNEYTIPILLEDEPHDLDDIQYALVTASILRHQAFAKAIIQRTEKASIWLSKATALAFAISNNDEAMVEVLVTGDSLRNLATLADATNGCRWETTVGFAAAMGHVPTMKCLLSHNFSLSIRETDGRTALHHAVWNGHEDMVQFLLDNTSPEDLRIQDADGETPLDVAEAQDFDSIAIIIRTALNNAKPKGRKRKLAVGDKGGSPMGFNCG